MINETAYATPEADLYGTDTSVRFTLDEYAMQTFPEKHWLLVDDNEDILTTLCAMFEAVTTAPIECHNSPVSALAAFAAAPDKYELVVTDYDMPGMNGLALCQALKAAAPQLKVILATGSDFFTLKSTLHAGFDGFLNKPCRLADIIAILYAVGMFKETACAA